MQIDEAPRLCPQPTGAEQRNGGPRCAEGVELLFAPVLSGQGAGCAEENMDAAQVKRQVAPVPLPGGQHGNDQHGFICQQQNRNAPQDAPPGAFRAAAVPAGCQQDADRHCLQLSQVHRSKQRIALIPRAIPPGDHFIRHPELTHLLHRLFAFIMGSFDPKGKCFGGKISKTGAQRRKMWYSTVGS